LNCWTAILAASLFCSIARAQFYRVDPTFAVEIDAQIAALALQPDGKVIIGGSFTNVNGIPRGKLARLHTDGTLDESFVPAGEFPLYYVRQVFVTPSNGYAAIIGIGNRRYDYDGGIETLYPDVSQFGVDSRRRLTTGAITEWRRWERLERYTEDGVMDKAFTPLIDECCLNRGVNAVAVQNIDGQEKTLIGGNFVDVNGHENFGLARLNDDGSTDTNFQGNAPGPIVAIDVLENGAVYAATRLSVGRYFADGTPDPSFANASFSYNDYYSGVKADRQGGVFAWGSHCPAACGPLVRRFSNDGTLDTNFSVYLNGPGPVYGVQFPSDGSILIAGRFTEINCLRRTYIARLIPSDMPDPLPCVPPPPPPPTPEPVITTTRLRPAKMACCWPTNYPEYTLQATKRLRPNHPEKEKWVTVTNLPVVGESTVCITNRILRWGRHYRLSK
jgi:uncharacterized delta-60 repeat protein